MMLEEKQYSGVAFPQNNSRNTQPLKFEIRNISKVWMV